MIVIADEAHRSQHGLGGQVNTQGDEMACGLARNRRDVLPNASFRRNSPLTVITVSLGTTKIVDGLPALAEGKRQPEPTQRTIAMNNEITPLNLNPIDDLPASLRVVLPDASGDAMGSNKLTDTAGVAIAQPGKTADLVRYGVAYAPNGGKAIAGAQGAAVAHFKGDADVGDGAMAYAWTGKAAGYQWSTAYALSGEAEVTRCGVAALLLKGSATIGQGGVACALNFRESGGAMVTDATAGVVSGDTGSVVVAFTTDPAGERVPVVGFIGAEPAWVAQIPNMAGQLLGAGVQFGLEPKVPYHLNPKTNQFVKA